MTPEIKLEDPEKMRRDDLRAEYSAIVSYHTALVAARFTIAGLLTGGSAFLAAAALSSDRPPALKAFCGIFAAWLTLCAWMLELRSRALYRDIAQRCIQIEHEEWGLTGGHWYSGFFSRQYNVDPPPDKPGGAILPKPEQDTLTVFGCSVPSGCARWITHSIGFDLLYFGAFALWSLVALWNGYKAIFP